MITKNFNSLPDLINHQGREFIYDANLTRLHEQKQPFDNKGLILAKVLQRPLKGVLDAHGKPYQPREYIYSPKPPMYIKDIFGGTIEVTDLIAAIKQADKDLGFAREAAKQAGGYPNVRFIKRNGIQHSMAAYHSHILKELLKLLPPIEIPDWLFVGVFPTCYVYADKRTEENRDYKTILRLFYNPLRIEIKAANMKAYPDVLELAKEKLKRLQMRVNEPLEVSATGQTTGLSLSKGPDVVISKY
jgi:hypothetical protein